MPNHIEIRGRRWFAYLDVPSDVRKRLKKRVFRKALKTDSPAIAKRRAAPLIEQWKQEIEKARGRPNSDDATFWRDALRGAKTEGERRSLLDQIDMAAWNIGAENAENVGDDATRDPAAAEFFARATGAVVATDEHLDEWIKSLQVKAKTAHMRRSAVRLLASKFATLQEVTRPEVRRWVTELTANLKPATAQRITSDCRGYWRYLATIEVVPEDSAPFDRLGLKVKAASWLPFEPADVVRLLDGAIENEDQDLADLIRLAMYSGARREELCSLPVEKVKSDRFSIDDAKTEAGIRTVPIHSELQQTMARLIESSDDGYVLSGLTPNANGDRGDVLGKRFARLKTKLGFGKRHVFHSLRGTAITMLERAGVPEGTVQDIVGHERHTVTGSVYSGKSTFEMRQAALALLVYPKLGGGAETRRRT